VVNRGTWRKTTGPTVWLNNATLRNEASGVLELQQGWIRINSGTATLQNDGLIKKVSPDPNNPTSASISDFPVTNRGRIEVVSGILNLTTLTQTDGETRIHRNASSTSATRSPCKAANSQAQGNSTAQSPTAQATPPLPQASMTPTSPT
jgi:hypothetical protein